MSGGFDLNKLMQQASAMQQQMESAREELAGEIVEASAGGGTVTVKATGAGEITEVKIAKEAINPDDPEMLEDTSWPRSTRRCARPRTWRRRSWAARWAGSTCRPGSGYPASSTQLF